MRDYIRKRLAEFFTKHMRKRGVTLGQKFANEIQDVLSVRAPTRVTSSGKLVAITPAIPLAPPRIVTEKLRKSVKIVETKAGCRVRVGAKYGMPLEFCISLRGFPHRFIAVAAKRVGIKLETKYE